MASHPSNVLGDHQPPRAARAAVAAVFFTNAAVFANIIPRYPEIKGDLELTNAALGSALAAFPLGALLVGLLAATVIARYGSAVVAAGGIVALSLIMFSVAATATWGALAAVLFLAGGVDAIIDVAQNAHGLRVQRRYRRSVVNSFHGVWSIGAVTGGLMGATAAGLSVPLAIHLGGSAVLFSLVAMLAHHFLLRGTDGTDRVASAEFAAAFEGHASSPTPTRRLGGVGTRSIRLVLPLGILAACGALVEDAGASWGAVYLRDELGAAAATAGLAFVSLQTAMTIGRLMGDRVVDRFGQQLVVRAGGAVTAGGMALALVVPSIPGTVMGYAVAGLGIATLVPAAMHAADSVPGLSEGVGLTFVSWMLRVGFVLSPPIVGLVGDAVGLRFGLLSVVVAGLVVVWLGRSLDRDPAGFRLDRARKRTRPGGGRLAGTRPSGRMSGHEDVENGRRSQMRTDAPAGSDAESPDEESAAALDALIDEASMDSFPASDPPSYWGRTPSDLRPPGPSGEGSSR